MACNYALEVVKARQRREAAIERARAEARRLISDAMAERDREIRRLRAEHPKLSQGAIGEAVGCSATIVGAVLNPGAKARYNERRRLYFKNAAARERYNLRRQERKQRAQPQSSQLRAVGE